VASIAGALIIAHQLLLVMAGNYAWLNWLTIVLGVTAFSDSTLGFLPIAVPETAARSSLHDGVMIVLSVATLALAVQPIKNLFSKNQLMNYSYNPLHIVGTYGAFGSVTKVRHEVVLEGALEPVKGEPREWKEYEFRAKPGRVDRTPPQIAPYHLRLDWLMWFLPLRARVTSGGSLALHHERWFLRLVELLLRGDEPIARLLRKNPFPEAPPRWIRARFYRYRFASARTRHDTGAVWERELVGEFLSPATLGGDERDDERSARRATGPRRPRPSLLSSR
jgi:hypothetical protein